MFLIKVKPINVKIKNYIIFQIVIHKILSKGSTKFVEKIGFYNTDPKKKVISLNSEKLGFWLNRGATINSSVYKILRKILAKTS